MTVQQIEPAAPANAVVLIDTDIQVEIAPSRAEEEALHREERERAMEEEREKAHQQMVARAARAVEVFHLSPAAVACMKTFSPKSVLTVPGSMLVMMLMYLRRRRRGKRRRARAFGKSQLQTKRG